MALDIDENNLKHGVSGLVIALVEVIQEGYWQHLKICKKQTKKEDINVED